MSKNAAFFMGIERTVRYECVCGKTYEGGENVVMRRVNLHKKLKHKDGQHNIDIKRESSANTKGSDPTVRRLSKKIDRLI